jgi:hypothetical protein
MLSKRTETKTGATRAPVHEWGCTVQGRGCPAIAPAGASPATSTFQPLPQGLPSNPFHKDLASSSKAPLP